MPGAAGLAEFDEEEGQGNGAQSEEDQGGRKRRVFPPFWIFILAAILAAGIALSYQALKTVPSIVEVVRSRDCMVCHAELKEQLKSKSVHLPFNSKRCLACHTSHGLDLVQSVTIMERLLGSSTSRIEKTGQIPQAKTVVSGKAPRPAIKSKLRKPLKKLCADYCHSKLMALAMKKKYSMAPFAKKQCISCHQAHASNQPFLLKSPIKSLCLSCHPEIAKYFMSDIKHKPFKAGDCISCHRGHASNVKQLLRRRPKTLCLGCHPSVARLMKLPVKMEPFELGNCPVCHNPHGSGNQKLLKKGLPELCFSCHLGIAKLRKRPVQMPPFRQGLCLGCHKPHASEEPKLLVAPLENNEICYLCHEDIKKNYQSIGHNRVFNNASAYQPEGGIGSCLNCHEPHGSDFSGLIQKEAISLCLLCHGPRRYFAHPVGFDFQDPWRGSYLKCTSCHNPMGSGIKRLKRRDRDGLCLSCHEASDPSFIFSDQESWHYQIPNARSNPRPSGGSL